MGIKSHRLYNTWRGIKRRCYEPSHKDYSNYGGRGITMCDKWRYSFSAFLEDVETTYQEGLTLDRVDNNKGYCQDNCKWATKIEQARNQRTNVKYVHKGELKTVSQIAEEEGIKYTTLRHRLKHIGLSIENSVIPYQQRKVNEQHSTV